MEFEKLQGIIAEVLNIEPEEVTMAATFVDDLGADSLDIFQIIMGIEVMTGASAEFVFEEGYGERYPNKTMELYVKELMENKGEVVKIAAPIGKYGSSDIGNVSMVIPSIHSYFAII